MRSNDVVLVLVRLSSTADRMLIVRKIVSRYFDVEMMLVRLSEGALKTFQICYALFGGPDIG